MFDEQRKDHRDFELFPIHFPRNASDYQTDEQFFVSVVENKIVELQKEGYFYHGIAEIRNQIYIMMYSKEDE
jgi:hypothetical protein